MTLAEAMVLLDKILPKSLNDLHAFVFQQAWEGKSYAEMADSSAYDEKYIKSVGSAIWKRLSKEMNQNVTKSNVHSSLEAYARKYSHKFSHAKLPTAVLDSPPSELIDVGQDSLGQSTSNNNHSEAVAKLEKTLATPFQDWGEAMDVSVFLGRTDELQTLQRWINVDRCRLIAVLGMGGMGKTALTVKLAEQVIGNGSNIHAPITHNLQPSDFEYVVWRSLRHAPSLKELITDLVSFLSHQPTPESSLAQFMYYLRNTRCLIILDNFETLLQAGDYAGRYRPGYEGYGELLRLVAETNHQSCIIFTSREKPAEVATFEGVDLKVRSLSLMGTPEASRALLQVKGLLGSQEQKKRLCDRYGNSPLALKIVANSIRDLFEGNVSEFLKEDTFIFNGIRRLLDSQFQRLSELEQSIMYWLAINRGWTSVSELSEDIIPSTSKANLLEALESLTWRSLIEKQSGCYTQQLMVLEYVTNDLIEKICDEVLTLDLKLFTHYALFKTTVKNYIRDSQINLILNSILARLKLHFGSDAFLAQHFQDILNTLRCQYAPETLDYGAGNLLNLCNVLNQYCQNKRLRSHDSSSLTPEWGDPLRRVYTLSAIKAKTNHLAQAIRRSPLNPPTIGSTLPKTHRERNRPR